MKKNIIKFCLILTIFFLLPFFSVLAQEKKDPITFIPQVTIPKSSFQAGVSTTMSGSLSTLGNYVKSIYNYLILIVGLVAAIALMIAGIVWLTAGGNSARISSAKSWIGGSLTGLVLALSSYLILQTINPALVDFRDQNITSISQSTTGCCKLDNEKDATGAFTGEKDKAMTVESSATECYNRAIELNEAGIKDFETIKKEFEAKKLVDKTLEEYVEEYMVNSKKFFPKQKAFQFTSCGATGIGVFITYESLTPKSTLCFKINNENYYNDAQRALVKRSQEQDSYWSVKKSYYFPNETNGCDTDFYNRKLKEILSEDEKNKLIGSSQFFKLLFKPGLFKKCFGEAGTPEFECFYFYEYADAVLYSGEKGKLGEPCGDSGDKGICISSIGIDCEDLGFEDQNIGYGGRNCGDNLKCCNKK